MQDVLELWCDYMERDYFDKYVKEVRFLNYARDSEWPGKCVGTNKGRERQMKKVGEMNFPTGETES